MCCGRDALNTVEGIALAFDAVEGIALAFDAVEGIALAFDAVEGVALAFDAVEGIALAIRKVGGKGRQSATSALQNGLASNEGLFLFLIFSLRII